MNATCRRQQRTTNTPARDGAPRTKTGNTGGVAACPALPGVKTPKVAHNSGNIEWYTPPPILDAARSVMGGIDCDPASCPDANRNVRASVYFTQKTNGLVKPWGRRVWLNPPYKRGLVKDFINALLAKLKAGEVRQACVIVNNATETRWFQALLAQCTAVCFLLGRVKFIDKHGKCPGTGIQGQAVLYFGPRVAAFRQRFSALGTVMTRG